MCIVAKIVLTGGPCAGKTTSLKIIEEDLRRKGYHVFIVSESATELINGGIRSFGSNAISLSDFQTFVLKHQLHKEKMFEQATTFLNSDEKCVIIYDRGTIDGKAYLGEREFNRILKQLKVKQLDLMDNYDMVIHLVTVADGKEEYYTLANNRARTESVLEAIDWDRKTLNAWAGHNNLKIIDNSTNFEGNLAKVLDSIHNLLGEPFSIKNQRKFLIDLNNSDLNFLDNNSVKINLSQIYLESEEGIEKRLRKKTLEDADTYYLTVQKKGTDGNTKIITDKKISENDYYYLLGLDQGLKKQLTKNRYAFTLDKQYFKLDIFIDHDGLAILEVEPTNQNSEIRLPGFLSVIKEVTNDTNYYDISLANVKAKKMKIVI